MAITGTGVWSQGSAPNSSMQDRDFFSGDVTASNSTYDDTKEFLFGFSAAEVQIFNTGSGTLVYQWISHKGQVIDNGVIPPASATSPGYHIFRSANKTGIRLRNEGGSTNARVMAIG